MTFDTNPNLPSAASLNKQTALTWPFRCMQSQHTFFVVYRRAHENTVSSSLTSFLSPSDPAQSDFSCFQLWCRHSQRHNASPWVYQPRNYSRPLTLPKKPFDQPTCVPYFEQRESHLLKKTKKNKIKRYIEIFS